MEDSMENGASTPRVGDEVNGPQESGDPFSEPKKKDDSDNMSDIFGSSSESNHRQGTPTRENSAKGSEALLDDDLEDEVEQKGPELVRILQPEKETIDDRAEDPDGMGMGGIDEDGNEMDGYPGDGEKTTRVFGPPMIISAPLELPPNKEKMRIVKMTNFVTLDSHPFDAEGYEFVDPDVGGDQAVMRWRVKEDGGKESNSRFVKWSDGSLSLFVGDECFDVNDATADNTYLYLRHQTIMQGMGLIANKLIFRPAQVKKRRMTYGASARKVAFQKPKVQKITTLNDPIREKEEKSRREEERIRDRENLMRKQKRDMEKYYVPQARHLNEDFLEEELDERANRKRRRESRINGDPDEDGEGRIMRAMGSAPQSKRKKRKSRDEYEEEEYEEIPEEDYEEPEWNDDEATDDEGGMDGGEVGEEAVPEKGEMENEGGHNEDQVEVGDEEDDSDDDLDMSRKRHSKRALVLSDDDDDDDD